MWGDMLLFKDNPHSWRTGRDHPSIPLTQVSWSSAPTVAVAYIFFGHVNIDFDGSPTAYGPRGKTPTPDDHLQNAYGETWFGVVALAENDPLVRSGAAKIDKKPHLLHDGKYPVIQQKRDDPAKSDPNPGFYVSGTSRPTGPEFLQNSHVDSSRVCCGALSGRLKAEGVDLCDYGVAIRHDEDSRHAGFYYADSGGNNYALGECSHKVGKDLGGSGRGNHFNNNFPVSFIVFPRSATIPNTRIASLTDDQIRGAITPHLKRLSLAQNAWDLALLLGFNETRPPARPQGTKRLAKWKQETWNPKPLNLDIISTGLRHYGWAPASLLPETTMQLPPARPAAPRR